MKLIDELQLFLQMIWYREGWTFESRVLAPEGPYMSDRLLVRISWETKDVHHPGAVTSLGSSFTLHPWTRERAFLELLHNIWVTISDIESHERMELLKLDGRAIWNPHPNWRSDPRSFETQPDLFTLPSRLRRPYIPA